jgi:predicted DNA-binding protein with PD1-like motif
MTVIQHGKLDDIIYAQLDAGADLMNSLHEVCKSEDIKTGVIMSITGALANAHLQHFPDLIPVQPRYDVLDMDQMAPFFLKMEGPLEVSGHGIIGEGWAPGVEPPDPRGFFHLSFKGHGEPYIHVHLVATNSEQTICGHLMEGSAIKGRPGDLSHFTVVIAKMSGVRLQAFIAREDEKTTWHHTLTAE